LADWQRTPKGVIDTSVLIAGIAGFKSQIESLRNPSAKLLRDWLENETFVWLVSEEILEEYKYVMGRLGVRRNLIGNIVNLLREEAEFIEAPVAEEVSPDPADDPFCACAETGNAAFLVTLNPKDFPQRKLRAKIIAPGAEFPTTAPRRARPGR
jgi:predicted nucleic acid-binding protein